MSEENTPKKKEKIIGIDLGTSNSACAILSGTGQPEIVPAAEGRTLGGKAFPSYVAFDVIFTRLFHSVIKYTSRSSHQIGAAKVFRNHKYEREVQIISSI